MMLVQLDQAELALLHTLAQRKAYLLAREGDPLVLGFSCRFCLKRDLVSVPCNLSTIQG